MTLRFAYWSTTDSKELINDANSFCHAKAIGTDTSNKVVHVEGPRQLRLIDAAGNESTVYEIGLVVDVKPQQGVKRDNVVDNVTFNVMDEKQEAEIEKLKRAQEVAPAST